MNKSPFTTKELKQLPRNAYAYSVHGLWCIRQDEVTVNTTVANGNSEKLTPSSFYATPNDALVIAEVVARSFSVAQHIDKAYNG